MDIGLDANDDLIFSNGDFSIDESTRTHQRQLLLNGKGSFKENPTICVDLTEYLDDEAPTELLRAIRVEFVRDGMDVKAVGVQPDGKIKTNAFYK